MGINNSDRTKIVLILRRIARFNAWLLLIVIGLLIFTGWGITHTEIIYKFTFGLVDRGLADSIHKAINLPLTIFFLLHVLINIRLMATYKNPNRNWLINTILLLTGFALLSVFVYVEYFS